MTTADQLERHRAPLTGHCYRMLGSIADADDAVQETIVRAWRSLERFDGRASLGTWLYRIATNVCIDALSSRARRERPVELGTAGTVDDVLEAKPRTHWLEPVPEAHVLPSDAGPAELTVLRQSIRLAFVAALQHLAPRQRAVLLLTEVLGWSAIEVAESLETSVAAVNSALQRARATLAKRKVTDMRQPLSATQSQLVNRYVEAFERYDIDALSALLHQEATMSMPPYTLWLRGPEAIGVWMRGRGALCRGSRLIATAASGAPAFAQYRPSPKGGHHAWGLAMLELSEDRITSIVTFLDTETLFPKFGLPATLPDDFHQGTESNPT